MKINIERIKEDIGAMMTAELFISLDDREIQQRNISFVKDAKVDIRIINAEEEYIVTGQVDLLLKVPCSRCLEEFEMPLEFDFNEEIPNQEVVDEIDIRPSLIEHIRLFLPMQTICDEDCQGLCPGCGINLNQDQCDCVMHKVDPRLAKLGNLLDKK